MIALAESRRAPAVFFLILCFALLTRLIAIPHTPTSWDEVDFYSALSHFDLAEHCPHFPGYPGYVLLSRAFATIFPPMLALALPGILSSLGAVALFVKVNPLKLNVEARLTWAFLVAFSPLLITEAARPMADSLAWAVALAAWTLLLLPQRRAIILGAVLLGVLPAIKADHGLLWALIFLCPGKRRLEALLAMLGAFVVWNLAFFSVYDYQLWLNEAEFFLGGHFQKWGGSVHSTDSSLFVRFSKSFEILGNGGLGLSWFLLLACILWFLAALYQSSPKRDRGPGLKSALLLAPMALWVFFGQNLDHPRHLILFLPFLALPLSLAITRLRGGSLWLALAAVSLSWNLTVREPHKVSQRGVVELSSFLESRRGKELCAESIIGIYVGESARWLRLQHPQLNIRRQRSWSAVLEDLESDPVPPEFILVSSELLRDSDIQARTIYSGPHPNSYQWLQLKVELPQAELPLPPDTK